MNPTFASPKIENQGQVDVIYLDLKKKKKTSVDGYFDSELIDILVPKLERYGVRGPMLQ